MTAVDTNVLVRLLTGDDPEHLAAARSLLENERIWIAKTVLLETAWVLRSLYGFEEGEIARALIKLLGLARVQSEDSPVVAFALSLTTEGLEFADALHLALRPDGVSLASFDQSFVKRAARAGVSGVRSASALK
jgi:predicted nucleic acid-binding protein